MKGIQTAPGLGEQVYQAILDGICDGSLAPGEHLVQEQIAAELGVSRQPVQQALALLKADGLVEDVGRRGLRVSRLDLTLMRQHYDIRAALDAMAARNAAEHAESDDSFAADIERRGRRILDAGDKAIRAGDIRAQIQQDEAFHRLVYQASGNSLVARTAETHWNFLRRAMADVLRQAEAPQAIWREHARILDAIVVGDGARAEQLIIDHVRVAASRLSDALSRQGDVT